MLAYCDVPQLRAPEAYIQFKPDLFTDAGDVTNAGTAQFLRGFMEAFRAFIVETLAGRPRPAPSPAAREPSRSGTDEVDVLVVGAGPVGLMTAHELLRRGIRVRLVDAASGPATTSRAAAIHPRTMETLDQLGLYEEFNARSVQGRGIAFNADGTELASMDSWFTPHATRFNKMWFLDQVITEELLRTAVEQLGGRVDGPWPSRR